MGHLLGTVICLAPSLAASDYGLIAATPIYGPDRIL
jgi:hypothetical protein